MNYRGTTWVLTHTARWRFGFCLRQWILSTAANTPSRSHWWESMSAGRELGWRLKSTSGWQLLVIEYAINIIDYTSLCSQHTHTHTYIYILYIYISTVYIIRYVYIYILSLRYSLCICIYIYIHTPYIHNIHMYAYFIYHNYIIFKGWFFPLVSSWAQDHPTRT